MSQVDQLKLELSESSANTGYLYLPPHPGKDQPREIKHQHRLSDLLNYKGPDIYFDLDETGQLIGIEILESNG